MAILILLVMMSVFFFGLLVLVAMDMGMVGSYASVVSAAMWSWIVIGPLFMLYVTYLVGFNCPPNKESESPAEGKTAAV